MKKNSFFLLPILMWVSTMLAQPTFPYNGVMPKDVTKVAFINAVVHVDHQTVLEGATLILDQGRVMAVGKGVVVSGNSVIYDLEGRHIYPAFIDLYSDYGLPKSERGSAGGADGEANERTENGKGAFAWNSAIKAEVKASERFRPNKDSGKEYRDIGFGAVLTHVQDGIVRGTGAFVTLHDQPNKALLRGDAASFYSFNKGSSKASYPSSLMGSIALLRQTYYDAQWYNNGGSKKERNLSLEALLGVKNLPPIFEANDKWNVLRADKVGDEFGLQYIMKTNGTEYQRLKEIKATNATLIVPLNFPAAWEVSDPQVARMVSLEEMKHWELAPYNCAYLSAEKIPFAITASGLTDKSTFLKNLRQAVSCGLSQEEALKALTLTPAKLIGVENEIGSLKVGSWANFFIASGNIFESSATIHESWIQGHQQVVNELKSSDLSANYILNLPGKNYPMTVKERDGKLRSELKNYQTITAENGETKIDTITYTVTITKVEHTVTLQFNANDEAYNGVVRLAGYTRPGMGNWSGTGEGPDGKNLKWVAIRQTDTLPNNEDTKKKDQKEKQETAPGEIIYPMMAYGSVALPEAKNVLIKNATVWTCEKDGKLEGYDLLISKGKIQKIGKNLTTAGITGVEVIDAKGKHVTPGIIDEHSHIALASVNEGGQACSAEVEQERVIRPDDINIYRQLSGGVTCSQLLHGSANPIGGQSAIIKLKWGTTADELLMKDAPRFIKFALGENVVQSNWPNDGTRFPQSRMGVEQFYYDHFIRAREYEAEWKNYNASIKTGKKPNNRSTPIAFAPRKDLELDALVQILNSERYITCHSYVQSEINMLMHVADSMGFKLNTFTHILEGYKVADKMKAHGAGGSTFSDWWAYKFEVKDAIPYNGALLWEQGITVAYNSDDAEMARRLNQEAAKAVKYGGVPEEEALKFVTLNPAKLLHIDHRTGSLKEGKDADLVIWSEHPLSIYAKAEQTFVEGICYYSQERDKELRAYIEKERARLIQKMLNAKDSGEPVQSPKKHEQKHFHCDTLDETSQGINFHYNAQ